MKVVILAGGGGTRLFPLSRINFPKQFLNIDSDTSLLGHTIKRFLAVVKPQDILIVTGEKYFYYVKAVLEELDSLDAHVIAEPLPRNTAPAIALAVKYMQEQMGASSDEVFFIAPADHIIRPIDEFAHLVKNCLALASEGYISALGIVPTKPETGYGYIKAGSKLQNCLKVEQFLEKPDLAKAKSFLEEGGYYWNSGMYAFGISTFIQELKLHAPNIYRIMGKYDYQQLIRNFNEFESISVDYAISEKSSLVVMVPFDIYWNDVGSWDSIYEMMQKDADGNVQIGDCALIDCNNSFVMSNDRLITGIGLNNLIIVETDDIIMVAPKGETQKVKEIVDKIKERTEFRDHTTIYRTWGMYKILQEGNNYKVKKLIINPGKSMRLHLHNDRSEHWVVTNGTAHIILGGDDERQVTKNQGVYVPKGTKHRISNMQAEPLEIIEVQNGDYLGEDDTTSFD